MTVIARSAITSTMSAQIEQVLPSWITPARSRRELEMAIYDVLFETTIDQMACGRPLSLIVKDDHREINYGAFLRWIHADPVRKRRYYEAQEIGTEALSDEMVTISDGAASPEDIQRSALRVETRWKLIRSRNRARYGDIKQLDINSTHTVNIREVLAKRSEKLLSMNTIEGVSEVIEDDS